MLARGRGHCEPARSTGARAKECAALCGKLLERAKQTLFRHDFEMCRALASRENHARKIREVFDTADENVLDTKTIERLRVRFVVALNR